jgi:hypothetical protein
VELVWIVPLLSLLLLTEEKSAIKVFVEVNARV